MMMMMMMAMMTMINNDNDNLKEGEFLYQKAPKKSKLQVRIELTTLRVLVRMLQPLSYWRLYGVQGQNLIITTPVKEDCIGELLEIGRPPA